MTHSCLLAFSCAWCSLIMILLPLHSLWCHWVLHFLQRGFSCMSMSRRGLLMKWCHFSFPWASWLSAGNPEWVPPLSCWPNTLIFIMVLLEYWEIFSLKKPILPDWQCASPAFSDYNYCYYYYYFGQEKTNTWIFPLAFVRPK